jgi:hypothetical protein
VTKRLLRLLVLAIAAGALSTCGESTAPPTPGWLNVTLATPNSDDGGIVFAVNGGGVDSVRTSYPTIYTRAASDSSWQVLVAGNLAAGVIAQVWSPDVEQAGSYSATPLEVAARTTFTQRALSGYTLSVTSATPVK